MLSVREQFDPFKKDFESATNGGICFEKFDAIKTSISEYQVANAEPKAPVSPNFRLCFHLSGNDAEPYKLKLSQHLNYFEHLNQHDTHLHAPLISIDNNFLPKHKNATRTLNRLRCLSVKIGVMTSS